jgi:hypothetical protein
MSGSILSYSSDISEQEAPPPLPAGPYPAEVIGAMRKVSNTSGNEYLNIAFRINPDAYPADFINGDPDGTVLYYNRLLTDDTPRSKYRMRKFVEAIGGRPGREIDMNDWLGLTCTLEIGTSEFDGEVRAEIKKVNPA